MARTPAGCQLEGDWNSEGISRRRPPTGVAHRHQIRIHGTGRGRKSGVLDGPPGRYQCGEIQKCVRRIVDRRHRTGPLPQCRRWTGGLATNLRFDLHAQLRSGSANDTGRCRWSRVHTGSHGPTRLPEHPGRICGLEPGLRGRFWAQGSDLGRFGASATGWKQAHLRSGW